MGKKDRKKDRPEPAAAPPSPSPQPPTCSPHGGPPAQAGATPPPTTGGASAPAAQQPAGPAPAAGPPFAAAGPAHDEPPRDAFERGSGGCAASGLFAALAADRRATLAEAGAVARQASWSAALHPLALAVALALHPSSGGPILVLGSLAFFLVAIGLLARAVTLEARERVELEALAACERSLADAPARPAEDRLAALRDPREHLLARAPIQLLALQALLGAAAGVVVWLV